MYLLTLVTPQVSPGVLRSQLSNLLEPLGAVLAEASAASASSEGHAALVRSTLGVLEPLFVALKSDRATLDRNLQLRGCWNSVLGLCMDARPKVRRRAHDLVNQVLQPASGDAKPHPYAAKTAEWAISALDQVASSSSGGSRKADKSHAPVYDKKTGRAKEPEAAAALRQKQADGGANAGIWVCGFLKSLASTLPAKVRYNILLAHPGSCSHADTINAPLQSIAPLSSNLIRLVGQQNPFLTTAAFEVFESLFRTSRPVDSATATTTSFPLSATQSTNEGQRLVEGGTLDATLDALCSPAVTPSPGDAQLIPAYLGALENAMVAASRNSSKCWARVPKIWNDVLSLALSNKSKASRDSQQVRVAGRDALCALVRYCIPGAAIDEALETQDSDLLNLVESLRDSLDKSALRFSHARPELLSVVTALVLRLRYRPSATAGSRSEPAACLLALPLVQIVAELRAQPKFEHREHADGVIGAAVEVCGPATVLEILPLGLLGENGKEGGRAWLLPLMRSRITNTHLKHFVSSMVPLSEALFERRAQAEQASKAIEAKVFEALTEQVWALFPGYCDLPTDLAEAFDKKFLELLANVLYSQPALRPSICRGLQLLVDRNESLASSAAPTAVLVQSFGLTSEQGKANLKQLSTIASSLLAVLFNVFSQSPSESRGYILDCLVAYLRVMSAQDTSKTYLKVVTMLDQSLPTLAPARDRDTGPGAIPPVPLTMLDLLGSLVPFLGETEALQLFERACQDNILRSAEAGVQKKAYKLLTKLMEGKHGRTVLRVDQPGEDRVGETLTRLKDSSKAVASGAKKDRVGLFAALVPLIPPTELHHLPSIIPEAVLATKEANQGARELAYELLVGMAHKMLGGGAIKRDLIDGAADGDEEMHVVSASLNEYVTMVAAGLASSSPHMISATITSLARLVYEFHPELPRETLTEILATLQEFLRSANREIVKSTLGFVKVTTVSLSSDLVDEHLNTIVPALLSSSAEHGQHFKTKTRHIFERLLRRFGYERILSLTDEDNRKLINNIKKRKDRAKRKKAARDEGDEGAEDEAATGAGQRSLKNVGADAFEEAIYGSDSDISDSDEEEEASGRSRGKAAAQQSRREQRRKKGQEYIVEDDDEPMDLLDRSAAAGGRITREQNVAKDQKKRKDLGSRFTLDEETGRMMIDDPEAPSAGAALDDADVDGAGRAYMDRERGTHGFTQRDGVIRLNKNNKRNREADAEMEEEQMAAEEAAAAQEQQQQQQEETAALAAAAAAAQKKAQKSKLAKQRVGQDFKAKKAGGDVTKGGQSPFAYVPLGQIGGKKGKAGGQRHKMNILAKDKKRRRT